MLKVLVLLALVAQVASIIDATGFGAPADNHKTGFGGPIPESNGLADESQPQLQLADVSPQDEQQQNVAHVKEMFSNVFSSIKAQREQAMAANATQPTD